MRGRFSDDLGGGIAVEGLILFRTRRLYTDDDQVNIMDGGVVDTQDHFSIMIKCGESQTRARAVLPGTARMHISAR